MLNHVHTHCTKRISKYHEIQHKILILDIKNQKLGRKNRTLVPTFEKMEYNSYFDSSKVGLNFSRASIKT
jgi:hypothetical protein